MPFFLRFFRYSFLHKNAILVVIYQEDKRYVSI